MTKKELSDLLCLCGEFTALTHTGKELALSVAQRLFLYEKIPEEMWFFVPQTKDLKHLPIRAGDNAPPFAGYSYRKPTRSLP
jgi:hypothetical protein